VAQAWLHVPLMATWRAALALIEARSEAGSVLSAGSTHDAYVAMTRGAGAAIVVVILQAWLLGCGSRAYAESLSPWGVSPSAALSNAPQEWLSAVSEAGATTVRGYDYKRGLAGLEAYRKAGLGVTGILMWSPGKPLKFPVDDLAGFRRYVTNKASMFGGYIKHWEVWNEPPNGTTDKSAASYAKIVAVAHDAAKAVNPQLQIGLAAKSVHIRFLAEAIAAGAGDKFDFISLHPYETAALLPQGWELPFLGIAGNVRAMLRASNPSKHDVPLWFTEIGVELTGRHVSKLGEAVQAATLVKIYTLSLAQGVGHIHWFDPRDSEGKHHGLLRRDGSRRPAFRALSTLTRALGKKPEWKGFVDLGAHSYGFLFAGRQGDVLVAWARPHATRAQEVTLPTAATKIDFTTGAQSSAERVELDSTPLLLRAAAGSKTSAAWRSQSSAGLPASWLCTTQDHALQLVAGEPDCGVHMADPAQVMHVAGTAELSLSGRSGARFAVDPQLIGYGDRALEITAVVRGHGRGKPGFNLKYEADRPLERVDDNGMVGAGHWNHVQGEAPMTLHWTVKDARFVGKYGVNLAIDCDSRNFCDFSLLRLSVRKL
jgi:hypothetical protein